MSYPSCSFVNVRHELVRGDPTFEAFSLEELASHSRELGQEEIALVRVYGLAALNWVENEVKLSLAQRTATLYLDEFPEEIEIRMPPLQADSVAITYLDTQGTSQTLAASQYRVDSYRKPARIEPGYGLYWPFTYPVYNAVTVTMTLGYTSINSISESAKQAVRFLTAVMFDDRKPTETEFNVVRRLLDPIRWDGGV